MNFIADLSAILPADCLITDADRLGPRLLDERKRFLGNAVAWVAPRNPVEASTVIQICRNHGVAIVPQGGNTGLVGGATPMRAPSIILASDRLDRIRIIDAAGFTVTAESGVILSSLKASVEQYDRLFPMWLGSGESARLGGLIGTNAGGLQVLRYGNMRELVLGIEAVLPDGTLFDGLYGLRKRNAGLDLKQLLIGGEGTMGFITAATLRLMPAERGRVTALLSLDSVAEALTLFELCRAGAGEVMTAFELITGSAMQLMADFHPEVSIPFASIPEVSVLIELAGSEPDPVLASRLEALLNSSHIVDGVVAQDLAQTQNIWDLREKIPSAQRRAGPSIKQDLALPISAIPDFLQLAAEKIRAAFPEAVPIVFGHLGDGNLHYNLSLPRGAESNFAALEARSNDILFPLVCQFGGDISAEHGIGRLRIAAADQYHDPVERQLMRTIKHALDPDNLFNPGVMV